MSDFIHLIFASSLRFRNVLACSDAENVSSPSGQVDLAQAKVDCGTLLLRVGTASIVWPNYESRSFPLTTRSDAARNRSRGSACRRRTNPRRCSAGSNVRENFREGLWRSCDSAVAGGLSRPHQLTRPHGEGMVPDC